MKKFSVKIVISALFILALFSLSFAQNEEHITITTYYPSPFGSYRELRAQRMAIGDTYFDGAQFGWPGQVPPSPNQIDQNADLVVEGNVGIGTVNPDAQLHIFRQDRSNPPRYGEAGVIMQYNVTNPHPLDSISSAWLIGASSFYGSFRIFRYLGGGPTDPISFLTIDNTGNVTIGQTVLEPPRNRLDINLSDFTNPIPSHIMFGPLSHNTQIGMSIESGELGLENLKGEFKAFSGSPPGFLFATGNRALSLTGANGILVADGGRVFIGGTNSDNARLSVNGNMILNGWIGDHGITGEGIHLMTKVVVIGTDGSDATDLDVSGTTRIGWEKRSQTTLGTRASQVSCSTSDKRLLGGGCYSTDTFPTRALLRRSYPINDTTWKCEYEISADITAYAFCARVDD
jgi:hypothetical protein